MPSVCNERGFTNIHKLFNIETCTISRRPHARFFNGGLSRKKRKKKKLSFTRLLNNRFLCFRQVVTKHKFKYVTSFMYNDKNNLEFPFDILSWALFVQSGFD